MAGRKHWHDGLLVAAAQAVRRRVVAASPAGRDKWGRVLGKLIWGFSKRRRQVAVDNLGYAFPEKSLEERTEIAKKSALHFARSTVDFMCAEEWTLEYLESSMKIEGLEHMEEGFARGKGVLMITGHLGNWERLGAYIARRGVEIALIVRDANQEGINKMVNDMRMSSGAAVIPRGDAARPIITTLRRNGMVGIISDQNSEEIFLPFFGKPAGTVLGPGVIRDRTEAAVMPAVCYDLGGGKYHLKFFPLLEPYDVPDGRKGEGLMRAINHWLEGAIREHPEQWLWMHDRWRAAKQKGLIT